MMNSLKKTLSRVLATPNKGSKRNPARRVRRNRRARRMARRSNASRVPRGILAGYGSAVTASFYTSRRRDGEVVRGFDLVTSPLGSTQIHNISYFITANPASWNGTRIAAIAAGYQNYRPLMFKIHYRPQVGSTSTISMFIGTIWQNTYITSRSSIEPSLVTSPGGTYLPAWQSSCSVVPLRTNLPQRMFPIRDPDFTTVPFSVVCRASDGGPASDSVPMPGRIFIEYAYEFRNAIGSGAAGFQPSNCSTIDIRGRQLFSGTTSIGYRTTMSTATESDSSNNVGWIVDMTMQPSATFPLFAHFDTDEVVASTSSGGDPSIVPVVQINGLAAYPQSTSWTGTLTLYHDDGSPA